MAELHSLRSGAQIRREASEWIARLNADRVSAEDRENFERWRGIHSRHAQAYEEVSATWRQLKRTGALVKSVELGQAFGAATRKAIERSARAPRRRRVFLAAAAMLAVAGIAVWWSLDAMAPRTLFQTAPGERAAIGLPDGSSLELSSNSLARLEYSSQARVVRLERGEAFFQVKHDAHRAFWVVAGGSWVRAVGTSFDVDVRPTGVRVTVSEGTVKVAARMSSSRESPSDGELERMAFSVINAGQRIDVTGGKTAVSSLAPAQLARAADWRRGSIYFQEDRLADVVEELGRYTALRIVVADPGLRDLRIGGTFETNAQGAEALLTTLEDGFGLKVSREGDRASITRMP